MALYTDDDLTGIAFRASTADESPHARASFDAEAVAQIQRLVSELRTWKARAQKAETQLGAIDSLSEEAWEDGAAVEWVYKIRNGESLEGLPTQEEYEAQYLEQK